MKRFLLPAMLLFSTMAFNQTTTTYPGNTKNGFGGAVGQGMLTIKETTDSVSFALTRGPGLFDSILVFYIDLLSGGLSSTAGVTGSSTDRYLAAAAGHNPSKGRSVLNFPDDFQPDGVIAFDKDGGKIFYIISVPFIGSSLLEAGSFTVNPSGTDSAPTYTQSSSKASLGLTGSLNFKFIATYIAPSASRSNEAFGDPFTSYAGNGGASGYAPYTVTSFFAFASGALPLAMVDFKAAQDNDAVNISWQVEEETNIDKYDVQRSANGIAFSTIASVKARNSSSSSVYTIRDMAAPAGNNYYRLLISEKGRSEISRIVYLNKKADKTGFIARCTTPGILNLTLNGISAGLYKLKVLSNNGQLVQVQELTTNGNSQSLQIALRQNLRGIYRVILQSGTAGYSANIFIQ